MATVTIGGTAYHCAEMNFIAAELAWPHIARAMVAQDPIQAVSAGIHVIAACIQEGENFNPADFGFTEEECELIKKNDYLADAVNSGIAVFLKRKMKALEIPAIRQAISDITEEAGLLPDKGEDEQAAPDLTSAGTETAPNSSQSSLPPESREVAGTE